MAHLQPYFVVYLCFCFGFDHFNYIYSVKMGKRGTEFPRLDSTLRTPSQEQPWKKPIKGLVLLKLLCETHAITAIFQGILFAYNMLMIDCIVIVTMQ